MIKKKKLQTNDKLKEISKWETLNYKISTKGRKTSLYSWMRERFLRKNTINMSC